MQVLIYFVAGFVIAPVILGIWLGVVGATAWHVFLALTRTRGPMRRDKW